MKRTKRSIIRIDEAKCTGCGDCIPNCPEGALQVIDGKARLVSDLFCDGLGACIGHCPEDAIAVESREAEEYDERKVMENIVKQGPNVIKAHLEHLKEHGQSQYLKIATDFLKEKSIEIPPFGKLPCGCPGSKVMDLKKDRDSGQETTPISKGVSQLGQWPVQLHLVPVNALYFQNADLVVAADCVPFAYPNFHQDFLKGKAIVIACPKLDDTELYLDKLTQLFVQSSIKSVEIVHMEVPCCFGLLRLVEEALKASGKNIPMKETVISVRGEKETGNN